MYKIAKARTENNLILSQRNCFGSLGSLCMTRTFVKFTIKKCGVTERR